MGLRAQRAARVGAHPAGDHGAVLGRNRESSAKLCRELLDPGLDRRANALRDRKQPLNLIEGEAQFLWIIHSPVLAFSDEVTAAARGR